MNCASSKKGVNFLGKDAFVGLFLALLLFGWIGGAAGQEVQTITAEGVGVVIGGDRAIARDNAINDALRKAVEQAVGTMVSSETLVQNFQTLNDRIYTQTQGYVQSYKVLSEKPGPDLHQVTVQAAVAMGNLQKDLQALGILLGQVGKPRIMILIAEQNIGQQYYYWWGQERGEQADLTIAENTIMDHFREKGFDFVDHNAQSRDIKVSPAFRVADLNDRAAITLGQQADAEVVIVGKALAKSVGSIAGTSMKSVQANISLRAIQTDNGRVLSSGTEHAASVHIDEITAGAEALRKASIKISDKMIDDIIKNFQQRVGATTLVQLTVTGLSGHPDLLKFKNMIESQVRGVERIHERSFSGNVAKMEVDLKGNAQSFSEEISRKSFNEFVVKVVRSTWSTVEINVTPR
jgi:hypothetical protein